MEYKRLRFDVNAFMKAYTAEIIVITNDILNALDKEIEARKEHPKAKGNRRIWQAELIDDMVVSHIENYAWSIIDSFGTGTNMDKENPALLEYMNSEYWHKLRASIAITGREAGPYTNIFGEDVVSSGKIAGNTRKGGIKPSYAIQKAEATFFSSRINTMLTIGINKFVQENAMKFFTYS